MDQMLFLLIEGSRNLWRHKLTALGAVFSVFFTLLLIGILLVMNDNTDKLINYFRGKYKIEVFFNETLTNGEAENIVKNIRTIPGVRSTTLITKEDAMTIFKSQFEEDVMELLGYNPFPASCVVNVVKQKNRLLTVDPIIQRIKSIKGVSDVHYQGRLIKRIESYYQKFLKAITYLSGIVLIISIIIISNTIRLTIYSKKELIRALELIGATSLFIQVPFLVEAMLHGLIGAVLAIITLMVSVMFVNANLSVMYGISFELNGIVIALSLSGIGIFISLIGSQRAIARFLK
ncbi:MAG: hypothetical protein HOD97_04760 [Candidatus Marinimicrobia bacterium]|jgi:cell division transport system permease protein|nr:hypothetical protein [Candidatus Neomarinimicrobiota bacterium]MBT3618122.1 hypothetical protein [Candidatus Neomarinimicrobiota bacterium]MBT3828593.1 hypothetical protein [Candidatus Neomarinimicrobiota bacterium]MBT3996945.1 hypothetical protein [Candidatus Neomarinimicrobiota bacterium]MBT4280909.1 hypothetical protein [Candidatus Neomarinimicrobiota bacterium]